jgi:hypothetical protein
MFLLVSDRQREVASRRFPGLLDKSMQQHHAFVRVHVEQNSCNPVVVQGGPNFMHPILQRPTQGQAQGPAKLNRHDVSTNGLLVCDREAFQPFPNWFSARLGTKEKRWNPLALPQLAHCGRTLRVPGAAFHRVNCTIIGTSGENKLQATAPAGFPGVVATFACDGKCGVCV